MSVPSLPPVMRALVLTAHDGRPESLQLQEQPVPVPRAGQVLVRMAAAPINPSDLLFVRGRYGLRTPLPTVPGFEGSGTVVAAGGVTGRLLVGRRVACLASVDGPGTWAEYAVVPLTHCLPLRAHTSLEQGATFFINPLTAWALMERARKEKHRAVVQTAAASSLGRMLAELAKRDGIAMVHVVRRPEQVEALRARGDAHVLCSTEPEFDERLRLLCHELDATLAFDAVAGPLTGRLLKAMPDGATVTVFGALSEQECRVDADDLIFHGKRVNGFWLAEWARSGFGREQLRALVGASAVVGEDEASIRACLPLESAGEAVRIASTDTTRGKVLFVMAPDVGDAA